MRQKNKTNLQRMDILACNSASIITELSTKITRSAVFASCIARILKNATRNKQRSFQLEIIGLFRTGQDWFLGLVLKIWGPKSIDPGSIVYFQEVNSCQNSSHYRGPCPLTRGSDSIMLLLASVSYSLPQEVKHRQNSSRYTGTRFSLTSRWSGLPWQWTTTRETNRNYWKSQK